MTTNFLLDTSMVVDDSFLDIDWPTGTQLAICSITVAELAAGPYAGSNPIERARRARVISRALEMFPAPLPFATSDAQTYGLVWAATASAGRKPRARLADLMIASVAINRQLTLATRNPNDFNHLTTGDLFSFSMMPFA